MTNDTAEIYKVRLLPRNDCKDFDAAGTISSVLARKTPDGFMNCDGKPLDGDIIGKPLPASEAERKLFRECEDESVTLLGVAGRERGPSAKLKAVRTGRAQGGNVIRRNTMLGVAPAPVEIRPTEPAPSSDPVSCTRYSRTDLEPEVVELSRRASR